MKFSRRSFLAGASLMAWGQQAGPGVIFEEMDLAKAGIAWRHDNAMSANRYMPEAIGPGCAIFDYDNDGWMDLLFVNSGPSVFYQPKAPAPRCALYKNNRDGTFRDVTEEAGLQASFFGMGCAIGDIDNDGWPDLVLTGFGRIYLYRNNRNGSFTDITAAAGLDKLPSNWTTSAAFADTTGSGRLDLFLCAYVKFGDKPPFASCGDNRLGRNFYCVPRVFEGLSSMLYVNQGNAKFRLASAGTPIAKSLGKALGVVATDINNDGRPDFFVANDTVQNFLFVHRGLDAQKQAKWEEIGLASEVGYGENGQARSGMGAEAGDFDQDGWEDLFVTNIDQEMYSLYRNKHDETFLDIAPRTGVAQATRLMSGWGVRLFDFDNDGQLDLLLANSHPDDMIENYSDKIKYKMPLQLFRNEGGKLRDVSREAGAAFQRPLSARGLATGDLFNRGKLDAVVMTNGGAPLLLKNVASNGNHWLGVQLEGVNCNRDAVGARVRWRKWQRLKNGGGSYLSAHDPRMVLGLGEDASPVDVEVHWPWPSLRKERFPGLRPGQYHKLREGGGQPA
ncbi:CRTAC1 family protein [Nostoc sp. NIES-2111]